MTGPVATLLGVLPAALPAERLRTGRLLPVTKGSVVHVQLQTLVPDQRAGWLAFGELVVPPKKEPSSAPPPQRVGLDSAQLVELMGDVPAEPCPYSDPPGALARLVEHLPVTPVVVVSVLSGWLCGQPLA